MCSVIQKHLEKLQIMFMDYFTNKQDIREDNMWVFQKILKTLCLFKITKKLADYT